MEQTPSVVNNNTSSSLPIRTSLATKHDVCIDTTDLMPPIRNKTVQATIATTVPEQNSQPKHSIDSSAPPVVTSTTSDSDDSYADIVDETESNTLPGHLILANLKRFSHGSWRLPVRIGDQRFSALLDTGAQISLIRKDLVKLLPPDCRQLQPSNVLIHDVNGEDTPVDGMTQVPIRVGHKEIRIPIFAASIHDPLLLGMNFMVDAKATIDFCKGTCQVDNEIVFLENEKPGASFRLAVRRCEVLPPLSETVVELFPISQVKKKTGPIIVQPLSSFPEENGLVMGRTLSTCDRKTLKVTVLNPTTTTATLSRGDAVAIASPVESIIGALPDQEQVRSVTASADKTIYDQLPALLQDVVDRAGLTGEQKERCAMLIYRYKDCFMTPDGPLGHTSVIKHSINTGNATPIKQRQRRFPPSQQKVIEEEVEKMLKLGAIEPSVSPWSSQVVLVRKKNGQVRFCVDYRLLNDVTRKDSYPLPNIQDTHDALAGAQYFCALDLAAGYWQVDVEPEDRPKTAFSTRNGLFQFRVMPFGLSNSPATFERLMETVLRGELWKRCLCYLDDVIVFGRTFDETLVNLEIILKKFRDSGLKLQPKKCELFKKELLYLGFVISGQGIKVDPAKVQAVRDWPTPCTVTDVRSFLGFGNYHRRFVPNYAEIAEPLVAITRGNNTFFWGHKQKQAFARLKQALTQAPKLAHPHTGENDIFILDTDASAFAIGGALSQRINGKEIPIGFASKTLSRSQKNYCTTYRELLAVVEMVQHFRHYLWGRRFLLRTDHSSLRWLRNYNDADGMLARWLAKLQMYDFQIEHRPGKLHGNADGLSRCHSCKNDDCPGKLKPPPTEPDTSSGEFPMRYAATRSSSPTTDQTLTLLDDDKLTKPIPTSNMSYRQTASIRRLDTRLDNLTWLSDFTMSDLTAAQKTDTTVGKVYAWVHAQTKPINKEVARYGEEVKTLMSRWKQLSIKNNLLVRSIQDPATKKTIYQTVLPAALRETVLHQLHDLRITGHLGIQRTIDRVKQRYYWPGAALDIARWCSKCPQCAARKGKPYPHKAPLTQLPTGAPFDRVAVDILDTHKVTPRGYRYILVISDYFTKYTDAFPLRRQSARAVAEVIVNKWIVYHGVFKVLHSDMGTNFESSLFRHVLQLLGVTKTRTTPYRPQSDGQVERFNRTLLNMLSAFVTERANDWDSHLPFVLMAYRTSVHSSTGCTPHIMVYGHEANLPVDLVYPTPDESTLPACPHEYVEYLRKTIQTVHEFAREHLGRSAVRQKKNYDAHTKLSAPYKTGDIVRYYYKPLTQANKFARPWTGPWKIMQQVTEVDYRIALLSNPKKTRIVHYDVLKPFETDIVTPHAEDRYSAPAQDNNNVPDANSDNAAKSPTATESESSSDIAALYHPWTVTNGDNHQGTTTHRDTTTADDDTPTPGPRRRSRHARRPVPTAPGSRSLQQPATAIDREIHHPAAGSSSLHDEPRKRLRPRSTLEKPVRFR